MVTGSVGGSDPDSHSESEAAKYLGLEMAKDCNASISAEVSAQDGNLASRWLFQSQWNRLPDGMNLDGGVTLYR